MMVQTLLAVLGCCATLNAAPLASHTLIFKTEKPEAENLGTAKFDFTVDDLGNFTFSQGGKTWLQSAPPFLYTEGKRFSAEDGSLKLVHLETESGADKMGTWTSQCFVYMAGSRSWRLCMKKWQTPSFPLVVFQQHFINGTSGSARSTDRVISAFPSFQLSTDDSGLAFLGYQGSMFGGTDIIIQGWNAGGVFLSGGTEGGPLAVYDKAGSVCIMAPFSEFMSSSREVDENSRVNWGVMGGVESVPAGFIHQTMVYCDTQGINQVFSDWGEFMRGYYDKEDTFRRADLTLNYLGYWTDGGAYYYYNTEPHQNYEQTMLDVKKDTDSQNIPYKYVQYDSWFYPKGPKGGTLTWNATKDIAPDGFQYLYNVNQWPAGAHNRYWSSQTPYAQANGGRYDFIVETEKAVPQDVHFWIDLFKEARTWGLILYEQDWLDREFAGLNATQSTVDVAKTWLMQMGQAARATGLTIQYCMSNPRHAMQSLEIPAVTQARVSGDYRAGSDQWQIGVISIFAHAMGIAPFKDTFWTITKQPGNTYDKEETHPELQAAVATLSMGPVGPSDMIQHTNVSMLMQCCTADGLILRPSKPATAIDKQFWQRAWGNEFGPGGEVWTTYSHVGQGWYFGIILAAAMDNSPSFNLTPSDAGFHFFNATRVMTRSAHSVTPMVYTFSEDNPLMLTNGCNRPNFCMYYTSPVFTVGGMEISIYGEEPKFVPMSSDRVANIDVTNDDVILTLKGTTGESTIFTNFINGEIIRHSCTFGQTGIAHLSLGGLHSSCKSY